jgi:hypothetical protein
MVNGLGNRLIGNGMQRNVEKEGAGKDRTRLE